MTLPTTKSVWLLLPGRALAVWGGSLLLTGCLATTGDLDRVHDRIEASEARIGAVVEQARAGLATQGQVLDTVQAEVAQTKAEAGRVADGSRERGIGLAEAGVYLAGQILTGYSAYRVTMSRRDHMRLARGEPVKCEHTEGA